MDQHTFDAIVRSLSRRMPRRRAGRMVGTGAIGVLLTFSSAGSQESRAKKHKRCIPNTRAFTAPKKFCTKSSQCCGKGSCCPFEEAGTKACVNLSNNASFCGKTCANAENCFNVNGNDPVCADGECLRPLT